MYKQKVYDPPYEVGSANNCDGEGESKDSKLTVRDEPQNEVLNTRATGRWLVRVNSLADNFGLTNKKVQGRQYR